MAGSKQPPSYRDGGDSANSEDNIPHLEFGSGEAEDSLTRQQRYRKSVQQQKDLCSVPAIVRYYDLQQKESQLPSVIKEDIRDLVQKGWQSCSVHE